MNVREYRRVSCSPLFVALSTLVDLSLHKYCIQEALISHSFRGPVSLYHHVHISSPICVVRKPDFAHAISCRPPLTLWLLLDLTASVASGASPRKRLNI